MSKKKKQKFKITPRQVIGSGLLLTFVAILWGSAAWADYRGAFNLGWIRITGEKILTRKDYHRILGVLDQASLNNIKLDDVRLVLEAKPFVKAARVSRHFPNTLWVEIVERSPVALLNMDPILLIDEEAIILPDYNNYSSEALIPVLSGFNTARELYPLGQESFSVKVKEAISILTQIIDKYPELYNNLSELTLNRDDEYVLILADRPTRVILGKDRIWTKIHILKQFEQTLNGQRKLTDYRLLDMRYKKQVVAREWT